LQEFKCQLIDIGAVARIVLARTPTLKIDSFEQSEWDKYANPICASVLTSDKSSVEIYQTLDRLIASAELRRDRIIRELQRHREQKAWQLDNASAKVIKGHFSTKNRSAA
jgi:hypothetical protein